MKRKLMLLVVMVLCMAMLSTVTAYATTFTMQGTDIAGIDIDDSMWYVFTRDNLRDNPELDELGVSYDYLYDLMQQEKMYMDAILIYSDTGDTLELFIRKGTTDEVKQLSDYSDTDVRALAEALAEQVDTEAYEVYETAYKYAKIEYSQSIWVDQDTQGTKQLQTVYLMEYFTIVNGNTYTLTFQSSAPFIDEEYEMMDDIADSVEFDVDPELVDEKKGVSINWEKIGVKIAFGVSFVVLFAVIRGVFGLIKNTVSRMKDRDPR